MSLLEQICCTQTHHQILVPRKKHMMCLNESILNPYPLIDEL